MTTKKIEAPAYWSEQGKFQETYNRLYGILVPPQGDADTEIGQILRYASKMYYDIYNNGGCNFDLPYFREAGQYLEDRYSRCFRDVARQLNIKDFSTKLSLFLKNEASDEECDQVLGVIVTYVDDEYKRHHKPVHDLIESAQWVLDFLEKYPPHFQDGKSMNTDLCAGIDALETAIKRAKQK